MLNFEQVGASEGEGNRVSLEEIEIFIREQKHERAGKLPVKLKHFSDIWKHTRSFGLGSWPWPLIGKVFKDKDVKKKKTLPISSHLDLTLG